MIKFLLGLFLVGAVFGWLIMNFFGTVYISFR